MQRLIYSIIIIFSTVSLFAEIDGGQTDKKPTDNYYHPLSGMYSDSSQVITPVDTWDTFRFSSGTAGYVRPGLYMLGPGLMFVWGFAEWNWGSSKSFTWYPQRPWGANAVDGGADKLGHMFGTYVAKRGATFFLRAAGHSQLSANLEGALMAELMQLVTEVGDGFSTMYGFDIWDFTFNNIGILIGVVMDAFPAIDRMFSLQWEYIPTKKFKEKLSFDKVNNLDFLTDYSGQKFILATKMAGMPYLSQTAFRYFNFDAGFFSRGYQPKRHYKYLTQKAYIGFSVNFAIAIGDFLPSNHVTTGMQKFFTYYHVSKDVEAKQWIFIQNKREDYKP